MAGGPLLTHPDILTNSLATSAEGNAEIAAIGGELMREIERNGWRDRWMQHVADEPIASNAADYRIFVGMVRKYMPGIPILDATMEETLVGSVDKMITQKTPAPCAPPGANYCRRCGDGIKRKV